MRGMTKKETGVISLEASIVVSLFIFLMVFMYSFFMFFLARNEIGHAVLSATNSLALDAYANSNTFDEDTLAGFLNDLYNSNVKDSSVFAESNKWYDDSQVKDESGNDVMSADFSDAIQERFVAYLTDGNMDNAEVILKRYHVVGGLKGLDFSDSYISDGNLHVKVKYTIELEFNVFGWGIIELEQSACSKLWK